MTKISKKELRKAQKNWIDEIEKRTGDNLSQMTDACNLIAGKSGIKVLGKDTLRHFYHNYQNANDRALNDRAVLLLYKAYNIEPTFTTELTYDMNKDTADISKHAKFCKQYITDISLAKGVYRSDIAKNSGIDPMRFTRLFNNKLPRGLEIKTLDAIKDRYKINYSPRFREFLESGKKEVQEIPVVGYISLKSSDQILLYPKDKCRKVSLQDGIDASKGRAIELKGPTINPMIKEGVVYYYNDAGHGVANSCYNETCVVETADGRLSVKMVEPANRDDIYRLHSLIGAPIEEAKLKSASKIIMARMF